MLMVQHMRKPFSHTLMALDVVYQAVLSPLNAGDCVPRLQKQVGIDPSCILVLCHAGTCRRGRRAWTGCALKRRVSVAHHVYAFMMFTLSVRRQEYLMKAIFSGVRCSAVGRTVIRQGTVFKMRQHVFKTIHKMQICCYSNYLYVLTKKEYYSGSNVIVCKHHECHQSVENGERKSVEAGKRQYARC